MQAHRPLVVPGVYDGLSAKMAASLGFPALYVGSYAASATRYGLPDLGYIGLEDMVDLVRRFSDITDLPIIADAEGGWGSPLQVGRSVRALENAGACAVHVEDHDFGKHLIETPVVLPVRAALDKLSAALDERRSDDFVVIARTDAGGDEGVDRALAFQDAGADAVFVSGELNLQQWAHLKAHATVPLVTVDEPGTSAAELGERGAAVVLYWGYALTAAHTAVADALKRLRETDGAAGIDAALPTWQEMDLSLGMESELRKAERYGLLADVRNQSSAEVN